MDRLTDQPAAAFGDAATSGNTDNDVKTGNENLNNSKAEVAAGDDVEISTGPEMCDCSIGFHHSVNLHEMSTLKKGEHEESDDDE